MPVYNPYTLIREYILHPEDFWEGNDRQLEKFLRRRESILKEYSWDADDFCWHIAKCAKWRLKKNLPTYYLSSFGSSGSHLVQYLISRLQVSHALGEVYIAPSLVDEVNLFSSEDRNIFMEAYHLCHTLQPQLFFKPVPIINTAHKPTLQHFSDWTYNFKSALILRDPVDLVLSRTFRKDEYRQYLGDFSDKEYLRKNIFRTQTFFKSAINFNYDMHLRFEDVVNDHDEVAYLLIDFLNLSIDKQDVVSYIKESLEKGGKTNKFSGEKKSIPDEYICMAKSELHDLSNKIGYTV